MRLKIKQLGPALALALVTLPAAAAAGAGVSPGEQLPQLSGFDSMAVSQSGYVFLSQGSAGKGIVVASSQTGGYETTLDAADNVAGMTMSPGGDTLYAALTGGPDAGEIAQITTSAVAGAFTQVLYPLGAGDIPDSLAIISNTLWASYKSTSTGDGAIGAIDLSTGTFTADGLPEPSPAWSTAPLIARDPYSGSLVAAEPAASSTEAASYGVGPLSATMIAQTTALSGCGDLTDLAVVPGGAQFTADCGASDARNVYTRAGFSLQSSHPAGSSPAAVAISPNGTVAAGTAGPSSSSPSSIGFFSSTGGPLNAIYYPYPTEPATRGLAWSADGTTLFALVNNGLSYSLHIYSYPTQPAYTLTLKTPVRALIGQQYPVTVKLTQSSQGPLFGQLIRITRTKPGTATMRWNKRTDTGGMITFGDNPPAVGTYTYTLSFAGLNASTRVMVTKRTPSLKIITSTTASPYQGKIKITAHLGRTFRNRTVAIYGRTAGGATQVLLRHGRVNSSGDLTDWLRASHSMVFTAVFTGDPHYRARRAARTVGVRARVAARDSGYYATSRINGTNFHIFHHNANLTAVISVAPAKPGQCVRIQTQEYVNGSWQGDSLTGCYYLSKHSEKTVSLGMAHAVRGPRYRVRVDYVRKSSDHGNLSTTGSWFYCIVRQ